MSDVVNDEGKVRAEIRLKPTQTKGNRARTVFLPSRLVEEIHHYLDQVKERDGEVPFVISQKSTMGFTANSLAI
jgi:integrase/recombinase XerD